MSPLFLPLVLLIFGLSLISIYGNASGTSNPCSGIQCKEPTIYDPDLRIEMVFQGDFKFDKMNSQVPVSTMTFLGPDDIILLNKNDGTVNRILGGTLLNEPLLDVNVANKRERGLLGVETSKGKNNDIYVYLYYTEAEKKDGNDDCPTPWYSGSYHCIPTNEPVGNRLYKYELKNNKLINQRILLDLPFTPSPTHNGGVVKIGPDDNVYVTVGDLLGGTNINSSTKAQNLNGLDPDGRSGILRITQDGKPVNHGILGSSHPVNKYYAYGIRNSFGIDFDPLTGNLWDTENGPAYGDEINLVKPGFNSGWERIQGIWHPIVNNSSDSDLIAGKELLNPVHQLQDFKGNGHYSNPEFIWKDTVGPTAATFLDSDKLGKKYENDLFVGSIGGRIFHFDLTADRTKLKLSGDLGDKIADSEEELGTIIFGKNLGLITDLEIGPDGHMYALSSYTDKPTIFRIIPRNT
jgi:glucose/arabinose dehydrogenase